MILLDYDVLVLYCWPSCAYSTVLICVSIGLHVVLLGYVLAYHRSYLVLLGFITK